MAGRTSTRSSNVYHPYAPPRPSHDHQPQSPVGRRTRSTRSQSIELGDGSATMNTRRGGRRGVRRGSVESVGSVSSTASKAGRKKKASRVAVVAPDLSLVAEDLEDQEDGQPDAEDEVPEMDTDHRPEGSFRQRSQSPGAMSQISGTTAMTSESSKEIAILDSAMIVDVLPELFRTAHQVLDLLAPPDPSSEIVLSIVKELQVPGSRKGKQLRHKEKAFEAAADNYTSDIDRTKFPFINLSFILRKLLGTPEPAVGNFRPDAVIYAANLAFLTKNLLVLHKEGDDALRDLQVFENAFPAAFLSGFGNEADFGNSVLVEETFELGLELRTQIIISFLRHWRESPDNFDPDQILAGIFFNWPSRRSAPLSDFEDALRSGTLKNIAGIPAEAMSSEEQAPAIMERVDLIRATFNRGDEAIADNDIVDFEQLEGAFPWPDFLTKIVQWSRSRLTEIYHNINSQGGLDNITKSLVQAVKDNDSQLDLSYHLPAPVPGSRQSRKQHASLLPAPDIAPASSGKSLYTGKRSAILLQNLKSSSATALPPSNQNQQRAIVSHNRSEVGAKSSFKTPSYQKLSPTERAAEPVRVTDELREATDDYEPMMDDDAMTVVNEADKGSSDPYREAWEGVNQDKNKENQPVVDETGQAKVRKRFLDRQANAQRIEWDEGSQDSLPGPSNRKRARQESESSQESDVFQEDQRPNPARRRDAPVPRRFSPTPASPPKKRARVHSRHDSGAEARRRPRTEGDLPASMAENERDDIPTPSIQDYTATAREAMARATTRARARGYEPQKRIPWSEHDSQRLLSLIKLFGCQWSEIERQGGFQVARGQVALKDRARNMKVAYLKSRIVQEQLPENFENIPLGKKEMNSVRAVLGNVDSNGYPID